MLSVVTISLLISLIINGLMFLVAFALHSDKLTDASYALSFIALSIFILSRSNGRAYSVVGLTLVIIWALRIGSFLLYRVIKVGKDARFDEMREHFLKFGKFWLGQALTVWVLMIPLSLAFGVDSKWHLFAILGLVVWLLGLVIEGTADTQKYRFKQLAKANHKWISTGLWHYSRHPNYFGEILIWCGIYLYVVPSFGLVKGIIGLISPLFITSLLLFVSGIPILEKTADQRWGNDPSYISYKKRTSLIVPWRAKS